MEGGSGKIGGEKEIGELNVGGEEREASIDGCHVDGDIDVRLLGGLVQHDRARSFVKAQDLLGHTHVVVREAWKAVGGIQRIGLRRGYGLGGEKGSESGGDKGFFHDESRTGGRCGGKGCVSTCRSWWAPYP